MFTPAFEEARSHMMPIIKGLRAGLFDSVVFDRPDGSIIKVTMVVEENIYLVRRQRKNGGWGRPDWLAERYLVEGSRRVSSRVTPRPAAG